MKYLKNKNIGEGVSTVSCSFCSNLILIGAESVRIGLSIKCDDCGKFFELSEKNVKIDRSKSDSRGEVEYIKYGRTNIIK